MREYNPKHHSRATFTNSRVKFVVLPVLCCLLPLLPDAVVVIGVQSATIKRLPSGIFIFPVCPKLAAVVESTLAVCDDVRRGNGLATGPGHTSGQVQISFFMSGKIVAAATLAVVPACCCYYFAQFSPPTLAENIFENACQPCEKRAKREAASSEARTWSQHMEQKPPLTASHLLNHPQSRLRRRRRSSPSTRAHNDAGSARQSRNVFNNFHILSNHPQSVDCAAASTLAWKKGKSSRGYRVLRGQRGRM